MRLLTILLALLSVAAKPTNWPYSCVCDIVCQSGYGGSATLIGVVDDNGILATAAHVVEGSQLLTARFPDGYKASGRVLGSNQELDLAAAVIRIQPGMKTPRGLRVLNDSDKSVLAVGFPYYCHANESHWTEGAVIDTDGSQIRFRARPYLHSGFSGGMLISHDGYYLGSTNGYGEGYSYASGGEPMLKFFSRWVTIK